jgi:hypothetical protein
LAESSKEGYGSKRAVLPMMITTTDICKMLKEDCMSWSLLVIHYMSIAM